MGGGDLCKRITATVVAVVMGVCGSGVAAWAAGPGIGAPETAQCSLCGQDYQYYSTETCDYTIWYGVDLMDGLSELDGMEYYGYVDSLNISYGYLRVTAYKGSNICKSCLDGIVNGTLVPGSGSTSGSTDVTAEVASSYSIVVPQAITLDGSGRSGTYSKTFAVTVKGDIGENQQVTVTATPPTMKCAGCADVAATFTGGYKTTWNRSEAAANSYAGTAADYTVSATLTPGEWTGTATFACSLGG